jgi:hypothetical protein
MSASRRVIIKLSAFFFLLASLNLATISSASAGCQDYPESVTPECVAENLAIEKLRREAYEADQAAKRLQEAQAAIDNAAKAEAERAATIAADNALAPDDCARSTNRYLQRCVEAATERARIANEAIDAAARAATAAADNALAPDDCARSTNKFNQKCIDAATEKARLENEAKNEAERAATIAADDALAPDDCARSTNRYLERCSALATESARIENEAIDSVRRAAELENLKKIARERIATNNCEDPENASLQICVDATLENDAVTKASASLAQQIRQTQATLAEPILGADGEVLLKALLVSKSLNAKDIASSLATRNIKTEDKKVISSYAQKLNALKKVQTSSSIKIPLSNFLTEEFTSTTPQVCKVSGKVIKNLKAGLCVVSVKFVTESGFEVETTKKFTIDR